MKQTTQQISRGDLLRGIKQCQTVEQKQTLATLLGYQYHEQPAGSTKITITPKSKLQYTRGLPKKTPQKETQTQRPAELFYTLRHTEKYADPETVIHELPAGLGKVTPLEEKDLLNYWSPTEALQALNINRTPALTTFLKQSLKYALAKQVDIAMLIKKTTRSQVLHRLPYKPRQIPAGRVYVLLDLNTRMLPFWDDAQQLCDLICRKQGRQGLDIRWIDDNPGGNYRDWFDTEQILQPWQALQAQSVVFIISDLGQLTGQQHETNICPIQQRWQRFLQQLKKQGLQPVVLSPITRYQQNTALHALCYQVLWHRQGALTAHKPQQPLDEHDQRINRILGLMSIAVHIEPVLLRHLLACLPVDSADTGIEASVYQHPDIVWGYTAITLKAEKRETYRELFKQETQPLQKQVLALIKQHHSQQFPAIWAEEVIVASALVNFELEDLSRAEAFMPRFTRVFFNEQNDEGMTQYARRNLQRLSIENKSHYQKDFSSALFALAYKHSLRDGRDIPAEYDAESVQAVLREPTALKHYQVIQQGETLHITAQVEQFPGFTSGVILADFVTLYDSAQWSQPDLGIRHSVLLASEKNSFPLNGHAIILDTGLEKLHINSLAKPDWADEIKQGQTGFSASIQLAAQKYYFLPSSYKSKADKTVQLDEGWMPGEDNELFGFDQYGLYADIDLQGIRQRVRYIKPTTFLMGSPETERDRLSTEKQHRVTLTQGYWIVDTAVTQALWIAVMGENPSHFKGKQRPVETVSWEEAQVFIDKLKKTHPALQIRLPTEAEWENACRAGSTTPFSFGEQIQSTQVNYNADYPYAGGEKGPYRKKTVTVKSLPANNWGLYEMHGNVWEWCQDGYGEYQDQALTNPQGETTADSRVLRGGSWASYGKHCRSAQRRRIGPAERNGSVGFRLVLGHLSSSQVQVVESQAKERRGAAERSVARQPEAVEKTPLWKNIIDKIKR